MARISLENVVKEFSDRRGRTVRALDRVNLNVADGERLAILGPSGSGKTTLLRIIAGLDGVTGGKVSLDGRDASAMAPQERDMAMVFQRDALLPHLTARENIALGLRLRGHAPDEIARRVQEAADFFRIGNVLHRLPRALSGGERQRTALARAFVRRPSVLLLDEPLSSLDAPLRAELQQEILHLHHRAGGTQVFVSHDQEEAMALGHRVAVIHQGAVHQVAEPLELYSEPATAFVAGFVGSPPMNLFRGTLALEGGAVWFHAQEDSELSLCLTDAQRKIASTMLQKEVTVGLRAEHTFHAADERALPYGSEVKAVVDSVQILGADAIVRWTCGTTRFITRSSPATVPAVGATVRLIFDMARARFFDVATGRAL